MIATARHPARLEMLRDTLGIRTTLANAEAADESDIILICVNPQALDEVLAEIKGRVHPGQTVISVVASIHTRTIEAALGKGIPVIRTMPNTPCRLRAGMTGICAGRYARAEHLALAERIFTPIGSCLQLDEKHMDAVTGLSASGPAYIYIVIESLAEGGVKVGLPREISTHLAAQTVLGAATMVLETNEHPAKLKDIVTTPAGCTIDGVLELEDGGLRVALIKAVVRATERARQLANG
jgi:pyrroline-5-carboxylate reductase